MEAQEVQLQTVTIESKNGKEVTIEAEVLLHRHDTDGSQIIVLKTPRRDSVEQFLQDEMVAEE